MLIYIDRNTANWGGADGIIILDIEDGDDAFLAEASDSEILEFATDRKDQAVLPLAVLDDGETETIGDVEVIDFDWIRDVDMNGYEIDELRVLQDKFRAFGDEGKNYIEELDGIIQRKVDEGEVEA